MSTKFEIKSERTGYCRICQCYEDENMFDMLEDFKEVTGNEDKLQTSYESFTRTTGIKVSPDDELSRFVCGDCFSRLQDFLLLRQQAEDSRRKMNETQESQSSNLESNLDELIKREKEESQPQCLICMGYDDEMTDIFSDIPLELDVEYINKLNLLFEEVLGISPSDYDRGDKLLCGRCVYRVIGSGMLRYQALKTDACSMEESHAKNIIEINQETFNCQICLKEFVDQPEYEAHLPCTNQTKSDLPYKCTFCERSFFCYSAQQRHLLVHTNERSHVCNICSKAFKYRNGLNYHHRVHSDKRPYACTLCSKTFKFLKTLKHHLRTHDDKKEFVCHICSKAFKEFWNLKEHARVHSTERPFVCKVCSKSFKYSSILNAHMNIHEINRPHPCPSCPKTFANPRNLRLHVVCHENDRPYICEICSKSFKHASSLRKHKIGNHTNERSQSYKCKLCLEIFTDKGHFNAHLQLHSSERKYVCPICSKNFPRPRDLTIHLGVHSDERLFSCDLCSKTFKRSDTLSKHKKKHKTNS